MVEEQGGAMRNIRQNLFFAFVYNALGVPIAKETVALTRLQSWVGAKPQCRIDRR
jgi:Cation transport ATPase